MNNGTDMYRGGGAGGVGVHGVAGGKRVIVDVGGELFETTISTLQKAGPSSPLARSVAHLASSSGDENASNEVFFDRDPRCFHILLSILRTGKPYHGGLTSLSSSSASASSSFVDKDALIEEAAYFGMSGILRRSMSPAPLEGIDLEKGGNLFPSGRDSSSAISAAPDGSLWVAHGSKITVFDWALRKHRTTLTSLDSVACLHRISDTHAAAACPGFPGLHIYDTSRGTHSKSLTWLDKNDTRVYRPSVHAIASSPTLIFAAFESALKTDNTVLLIDRVTLQSTGEVARQTSNARHCEVATKLYWLSKKNLLLTVGIHGGSSDHKVYSGYIRLWDLRQNQQVWEWKEPNVLGDPHNSERESFFDIAPDEDHAGIFKISRETGLISMADLRHMKAQNPWMCLSDTNPAMAVKGTGCDSKLLSYKKQLFCSRGGDLEVWSEVPSSAAQTSLEEKEYFETSFRRNIVEYSHIGDEITCMDAGGDRLFIARKKMQGVQVWETKRMITN